MARTNLGSMSVEALLNLRDEIGKVLSQKAVQLQNQLSRLGREIGNRIRRNPMKGRKVAIKYRDRAGNTWTGRGAQPVWLREKLKTECEARRLCRSKDSGFSQSFPEKNKEAPTQKVTRFIRLLPDWRSNS